MTKEERDYVETMQRVEDQITAYVMLSVMMRVPGKLSALLLLIASGPMKVMNTTAPQVVEF